MYNKKRAELRAGIDIDVYVKIAFAKTHSLSKFMSRVYAVNEPMIHQAEYCKDPKTREILLKVLENNELRERIIENRIANMGSKIISEENEEKQQLLADFLCDEDVQKLCNIDQILGLFDQLNAMQDIEKCKRFIEHIKTLKISDEWTSKTIVENVPKEIIEETIDTSKIKDLKKLAELLDKADAVSFSSEYEAIDGKNAYIKVKYQSSKNDN